MYVYFLVCLYAQLKYINLQKYDAMRREFVDSFQRSDFTHPPKIFCAEQVTRAKDDDYLQLEGRKTYSAADLNFDKNNVEK